MKVMVTGLLASFGQSNYFAGSSSSRIDVYPAWTINP